MVPSSPKAVSSSFLALFKSFILDTHKNHNRCTPEGSRKHLHDKVPYFEARHGDWGREGDSGQKKTYLIKESFAGSNSLEVLYLLLTFNICVCNFMDGWKCGKDETLI